MASLALLLAMPCAAQDARTTLDRPLATGDRVRVFSPDNRGYRIGTLISLDSTSLVMVNESWREVRFPRSSITKLDRSVRRRRYGLRGFTLGAAFGALVGVTTPVNPDRCAKVVGIACSRRDAMAAGIVPWAMFGWLIGYTYEGETWHTVLVGPAPPSANAASGLALGMRHYFR